MNSTITTADEIATATVELDDAIRQVHRYEMLGVNRDVYAAALDRRSDVERRLRELEVRARGERAAAELAAATVAARPLLAAAASDLAGADAALGKAVKAAQDALSAALDAATARQAILARHRKALGAAGLSLPADADPATSGVLSDVIRLNGQYYRPVAVETVLDLLYGRLHGAYVRWSGTASPRVRSIERQPWARDLPPLPNRRPVQIAITRADDPGPIIGEHLTAMRG